MVDAKSEVGYRDRDESFGQRLLWECDTAVPVSPKWTPPKARGKPRGLSVNPGHKNKGILDD